LNGSGILVNGPRDYDIQIKNGYSVRLYHRVLQYGSIGLGEAYMDGWWTCKKLDIFFTYVLSARLEKKLNPLLLFIPYLQSVLFNQQNRQGSLKVAEEHYNLSTELYESFLDPYNQYTCGYFKNTNDLNRAQEQKLDLICRKLKIKPGDEVLDIGCGWLVVLARKCALTFRQQASSSNTVL
jgi:cyclopropane-fatty-acyl-phospholipid synthase